MTENYTINYSQVALDDLREIYAYIAKELFAPDTAKSQLKRIREKVRSLSFMPARYALVEFEPWHSVGIHQITVNNFIVYYLIDNETGIVTIVRIFYGGRNIEEIISSIE